MSPLAARPPLTPVGAGPRQVNLVRARVFITTCRSAFVGVLTVDVQAKRSPPNGDQGRGRVPNGDPGRSTALPNPERGQRRRLGKVCDRAITG